MLYTFKSIIMNRILPFAFLLTSFCALAQQDLTFACSYTSNSINEKEICDWLGFQSRPEAQRAVSEIVSRSGLKQNFYVMECPNIDNCYAATRNGERLIVYDGSFMRRVNNMAQTDWAALSILAHEIGHHLQGHTLKQGGSDKIKELEADEFSGFVMYQMGANLSEAQSAIYKLTSNKEYGTHPPRKDRLTAIETGFENAKRLYPHVNNSSPKIENTPTKEVIRQEVLVINKPVFNENTIERKVKTGCLTGNCRDGFGVAVNRRTLEKYSGNWDNGRRAGYGIEYYKNGEKKYEGDFLNSQYHGMGTYYFHNGDKYVGMFKNHLMNDQSGIYMYANGDTLHVRYVNGKRQGKGKIVYYSGVQGTVYFDNDIQL